MKWKTYARSRFPRVWHTLSLSNKLYKLALRSYGYHSRTCPICGYRGKFLAEIHFPDIFTYDAMCPSCGSLPRNRLLYYGIIDLGIVKPKARILHFAPERCVSRFIEPGAYLYKTADLFSEGVDLKINIENIAQPDHSWDIIICSHVLEHVEHHAALKELYRILAPGGVLLALVPIVEGWESHFEIAGVETVYDRALFYGKTNHLRRFGRSIRADMGEVGFVVNDFSPKDDRVVNSGLIPGEVLFVCRKAAAT